ncbi:hypothetical protein AB432_018525 [Brevibacillus brevis]|uniref:Uncharacterized protein n=1 Tax=Brevibacillus brevis TaxID=1393 RepID=A0A2Z4MKD2_BREBE|nr:MULTISPECIES: hypothetical protein [Brevibacillus]AWX56920.1 hypothetical protein AB432_018525 [Brevibacillus brevis]MDC0760583.1 hypothetical protein [Brevibacillus sp. AG]
MKTNQDWNRRMLEVLEKTYQYDAAMTEVLMPEVAKQYTTADEQNENYRDRLLLFKEDLEEEKA